MVFVALEDLERLATPYLAACLRIIGQVAEAELLSDA